MAIDTKPVAWMHEHPDHCGCEFEEHRNGAGRLTEADRADGWTETPLYASPQPCADCDKLRAEVERLRGVLDRIYMEDRRIVERWRQSLATGDSHLDETIVLGRYGEMARAALNGGKHGTD